MSKSNSAPNNPALEVFRGRRPVNKFPANFYVRKRAGNGKIVWCSEGHKTKRSAMAMARHEQGSTIYFFPDSKEAQYRLVIDDLT